MLFNKCDSITVFCAMKCAKKFRKVRAILSIYRNAHGHQNFDSFYFHDRFLSRDACTVSLTITICLATIKAWYLIYY